MRGGAAERGTQGAESVHEPFGDFVSAQCGGDKRQTEVLAQYNTEKLPEMLDVKEIFLPLT